MIDILYVCFQISDIHISIFQDASRISDFREFCDVTVSAVMPQVVLVSGIITCFYIIYLKLNFLI